MPLRFMTAGESHGPALVAILEGMPAGLKINSELIDFQLARRQKGFGGGGRMKIEQDHAQIVGGLMAGRTIGTPLIFYVENRDHAKWRGKPIPPFTTPRPGHADLTGALKYGYRDLRPALERASARETAARVAAGAVCRALLDNFGIQVGGYVCAIGGISAALDAEDRYPACFIRAEASEVRCPDLDSSEAMVAEIRRTMKAGDTLGGVIEIVALGLPPGLGSYAQWDRRLDARLGAAVLSVPAVKGVEFGPAFSNAALPGTEVHDPICLVGEDLVRSSNRAGGLEGGVTNGEPLVIRAAMKPIPTTLNPQRTVDLSKGEETLTHYERSDFCPVPRAVPVLEAMVTLILAEALLEKLGGDTMDELIHRFEALPKARLSDLSIDGEAQVYWSE